MSARARIVSVNVGPVVTVDDGDRRYETAIDKRPAAGAVALRGVNFAGDDQADPHNHGGPDRAVYAYAAEDYAWWSERLARELGAGDFGENLTTAGIDVNAAVVGERWQIGAEVELEVSVPRVPCFKLAAKMADPRFVATFGKALRPGPYLRVLREGDVRAGDALAVTHRPAHRLTIAEVTRIYLFDHAELATLLRAPELGEARLDWVRERLARAP